MEIVESNHSFMYFCYEVLEVCICGSNTCGGTKCRTVREVDCFKNLG